MRTAKKIRTAEKTVAKAREALEKAEAGLDATERVAEAVGEGRRRPFLKAFMLLALLGLGMFAFKANRD